jgi:tetratricopeptide (TPR) repeat protein
MSSRLLFILMALTSIFVLPGAASQTPSGDPVLDLLTLDDVDGAEALLNQQTASPHSTALGGEIAYRRGNFESAETHYRSAATANVARAHFGLGKLALARMRINEAIRHFDEAIRLDPKEPK